MATTDSTWTFERISGFDRDGRHEVFGLHGPTGPWVGVDDPSAEAR
jgi:hypothetical protein